jgi:hypothetical protein
LIKLAQDKIDEATRKLAEIDLELADLQGQIRRGSKLGIGRYTMRELTAYMALVRERRDQAQLELLELVDLAEMPVEEMGRA